VSDTKPNLEKVFWLGGSPCSGKSSVSRILKSRFDLDVYHVDESFDVQIKRLNSESHSALTKWCAASWNQRWMQPLDNLVNEVIACYQEHFSLVLDEILSMPKPGRPLLVEGTALLPRQIAGISVERNQAIWVVPTADFQLKHYSNREWIKEILQKCDDPEAAFRNWMERDIQFALWVIAETKALDYSLLIVDGEQTIEENAKVIASHFGFSDGSPGQ
jgi:hypothetical protein